MATKKNTTTPKKTTATKRTTRTASKDGAAKTAPAKTKKNNAEPKKTNTKTTTVRTKSPKAVATAKGEPYIAILSVELDPDNIGNGAFELDWNEKFITNLVRAGYQNKPGETEDVIVDRWFQEICRNIAQENFEQWEANQPMGDRPRVINRRDVGDGRTEVS
jgi:hypothetical protein